MRKALIVDDEENARLYLARMIAGCSFEMEIQFASTPAEALFVLEKFKPDILFIDVEMPGMSGLETIQVLREKHPVLPIIIVSGYDKPEYIKKALRLDVVDYLSKPVNPDELEIAINKAFCEDCKQEEISDNGKTCLPTIKGTLYISLEEILYFKSDKRNSIVYFTTDEKEIMVRENLSSLENKLPSNTFLRVSRQYIINTDYIKFVNREKYIVLAANDKQIKLDKIFPHIIEKLAK